MVRGKCHGGRSVWSATFALLATAAAAQAAPAKTTWTGYLYQGPGYHFAVVDEVPEAATLDVADCTAGWCRVTYGERIGYLPAEIVTRTSLDRPPAAVLAQPAAALSPLPPPGPCFDANQTGGNGGNAMTVFCRK